MGVEEYNKLAAEMNEGSKSKSSAKKETKPEKADAEDKPKSKKK